MTVEIEASKEKKTVHKDKKHKKNKHKGKSALKTPLIMPLNLRQGITLEEIETYSAPPTEDTGKKKMDKAPFRGYRAKKPKFGRLDLSVSGFCV